MDARLMLTNRARHTEHRPAEIGTITHKSVGKMRGYWRLRYEDGTYYDAVPARLIPISWFSVMVLYPEGSGETGDTFYTSVEAVDRNAAVKEAIRECCTSNDWTLPDDDPALISEAGPDYDYDDFSELLVLAGQHHGI